jgi:SAM-dependent methyltransferase
MDEAPTHFSDHGTVEARRTSFGAGAAAYDAVRPPWPEPTVDWLLGAPARPLQVLDLGAGTGLGTRTIAALGHEVTAVDPSPEMLVVLDAACERLPAEVTDRIRSRVGTAEDLVDRDATYDAVTVFQAWHWFDHERAELECARVTRPGGRLGLAWHSWSDQVPWLRELGDLVGTPEMVWDPDRRGASPELPRIAGFESPDNRQFAVDQQLSVDDLVRLAASWSPVAVREDRDEVLSAVRELAGRVAGTDATLVFRYVTDCYRYRRR